MIYLYALGWINSEWNKWKNTHIIEKAVFASAALIILDVGESCDCMHEDDAHKSHGPENVWLFGKYGIVYAFLLDLEIGN